MPTQGGSIPVLSVEKLWLDNDGRGLNVHWDGTNFWSGAITGKTLSGATYLPAASTSGWFRIQAISGSTGSIQTGYIPIFKYRVR
jgi:hypothetical protein